MECLPIQICYKLHHCKQHNTHGLFFYIRHILVYVDGSGNLFLYHNHGLQRRNLHHVHVTLRLPALTAPPSSTWLRGMWLPRLAEICHNNEQT